MTVAALALFLSSHEAAVHVSLLGSRLPPAWHRTRRALTAGLGLDTGAHVVAALALWLLASPFAWASTALAVVHFGYWALRTLAKDRFFHAAELRNEPRRLKKALLVVDAGCHTGAVVALAAACEPHVSVGLVLAGCVSALVLFAIERAP